MIGGKLIGKEMVQQQPNHLQNFKKNDQALLKFLPTYFKKPSRSPCEEVFIPVVHHSIKLSMIRGSKNICNIGETNPHPV